MENPHNNNNHNDNNNNINDNRLFNYHNFMVIKIFKKKFCLNITTHIIYQLDLFYHHLLLLLCYNGELEFNIKRRVAISMCVGLHLCVHLRIGLT